MRQPSGALERDATDGERKSISENERLKYFMNEAHNSIWKKSWKGPGSLLLFWLCLMIATGIIFMVILLAVKIPIARSGEELRRLAAIEAGVTTMFFLVLFIRWLFCWRNFKRALFALACLATLVALCYAEEDWRGWHAWNQFKQKWEAKGEHFDLASIVPPPVPDEQNFAMSPVCVAEIKGCFLNQPERVKKWYGDRLFSETVSNLLPQIPIQLSGLTGTNWVGAANSIPDLPNCNYQTNIVDLRLWQKFYRDLARTNPAAGIPISPQPQTPAADVLLALSKYDGAIEEEREASRLAFSRFPVSYDDANPAAILLPHLGVIIRRHTEVLQLRAVAELENNRQSRALDDVKLMLRLIGSVKDEPILISQLVRAYSVLNVLQVVGQGLAEHHWTAEQLAELDSELAKLDFPSDCKRVLKAEMAGTVAEVNYLRATRDFDSLSYGMNFNESTEERMAILINHYSPGGWFYESQLRSCRILAEDYLPAIDRLAKTIAPKLVERADKAEDAEAGLLDPQNTLKKLWQQSFKSSRIQPFAFAQAMVDLARTAIALERYRVARGEFPESLDALAPQFIAKVPHDVIGGQPLKYRRAADGQFALYSIGWNEKDDGGVVVFKKGTKPSVDLDQGDWVWRHPPR